jgi:serine/threonine protein kinase
MIQHLNYTVKNLIGQGGMATVYLANHNTLNKPVAIKLLNKEFIHNENVRKRFLAEARNLFSLHHPNIIKVTDLIDEGDTVAFVMEYMEGQTLKDYLDTKGKLNDEEIKKLFVQMLDAVIYVHEQGLIHRDIKPSNFMINNKGLIKLLDFGIAKNTDANSADYTQTGTTQNMGTPMYMSPEQIKSTKDVTAQTDIYSLGVVLWQMVTGQKPYETQTLSSFQLMTKIVNDTLPKTSTIWDDLIQKATRKDISDRFSSCHDFYSAIQMPVTNKFDVADDKTILNSSADVEKTTIENSIKQEAILEGSILASNGVLKYGFINLQGNWVIQPMFDSLDSFSKDGFTKAKLNDKWGFINRQGNWVIEPMFDSVWYFDDQGYAQAYLNDKWGFINRQGNWVIQPMFDLVLDFDDQGYAKAYLNDKEGFFNRQGNWVIQPMFDNIGTFDDQGYAYAKLNDKWGFINREGNWIIQPMFDRIGSFDNNGYAGAYLNDKYGIINRQGKWVIQPMFDRIGSFDNNGYAGAYLNDKGGFINQQGNWVIQPMFDEVMYFDDQGYACTKRNEKYGFINRQGNWVIQPMFDGIDHFDNQGFAAAELNYKFGIINRQGSWVIQPMFDLVGVFDDQGFAEAHAELNFKFGIINREGSWVIQPTHLCKRIDDGIFKVSLDNKYGYMNGQGEWLIRPMFDYIQEDFEGDAMIWNDATKEWDLGSSSINRSLNQEDINECFGHLVGKEKVYLGENIPEKKLANFCKKFNNAYFEDAEIFVYFDDTLFGKGDDGFAVLNVFSNNYLFVRIFGGSEFVCCFENDQVNVFLTKWSYSDSKGVVINVKDQNDKETVFELGFKNDVGKGLVSLLDKYYDDELDFEL